MATIKKTRGNGINEAIEEVIFEGTLNSLVETFAELLKMGKTFDDSISLAPKSIQKLVNDLNKTTYQYRDYNTTYKRVA